MGGLAIDVVLMEIRGVRAEEIEDVLDVSDDNTEVGTLCRKAGSGRGVPDIFLSGSRLDPRLRSLFSRIEASS